MGSFYKRNKSLCFLYSTLTHRYEYSFSSLRDLMAYLAHYNVYLDCDHPLYHEFAGDCFNEYAVNYFVGLRIAKTWDEIGTRIDVSEYKKKSITKLVKISGVHYEKKDKVFITKDLIILDENYEVYNLDLDDIDAILNRICNRTDYKSNRDFPDFKYRSDSVPGVHICRSYSVRRTRTLNKVRSLQNSNYDLTEYTGVRYRMNKKLRDLFTGWDYRTMICGSSWKRRKNIKRQWQKHLL